MLDRLTWLRMMRKASRPLIFLIVGYEGYWCGLGWKGTVRRLSAADI
jgi:hypothetical protein